MMIREQNRDLSEPKTLKVTLPTKLHLQLHQLKILAGQNISDTVQEALETYFAEVGVREAPEGVEAEEDTGHRKATGPS